MFHVGQLVECVDDKVRMDWTHFGDGKIRVGLDGLKAGTVYTICGVFVSPIGFTCVRVAEIKRPPVRGVEMGFRAERFRPLSDSRLAVFRQHLAPVRRERETT